MLKLLIADDNKDLDISILNFIREKKLDYINIEGICTNGLYTYNMIKNLKPDFVILDIKMPIMNGLEIIKKLINEEIKLPKIILITGFADSLNNFSYGEYIYKYLFKPFDIALLVKYIENYYIDLKENDLCNEIVNILNNFDFNVNSLGYKYLFKCIEICMKDHSLISNFEKKVYPKVSKIFNISNSINVKWAIEKCIDSMFRYTKTSTLNKFFPSSNKLSPKIFIKRIIEIITIKEN